MDTNPNDTIEDAEDAAVLQMLREEEAATATRWQHYTPAKIAFAGLLTGSVLAMGVYFIMLTVLTHPH